MMIGDALEITIIVSMVVLVVYPSSLMIVGMFQERCRRRAQPAKTRNSRQTGNIEENR